jgi:hypothetical protein
MAWARTNLTDARPVEIGAQSNLLQRRQTKTGAAAASVPPIVDDVLRKPGQALDSELRATMERRFDRDFSAVRVHTDDMAARSAQAVDAQAYTVAPHIVFGRGGYDPSSGQGQSLLVHELTHVAQQRTPAPLGSGLRIDPAASPAEQEADRFSRGMAEAVPQLHPAQPGTLHRSVLGAGIGAGVGGAGLGALGAGIGLAASKGQGGWGAFGGIVGGLAGIAGGLVVGDLISRDSRPLTGPEKTYAGEIFRNSIDLDKVTITKNSALAAGASRTFKNTINFTDNKFKPNSTDLTDDGSPHDGMHTLIHELVHVWQYQNQGLEYISSSLVPQAVAGSRGSRSAAYDWRDAAKNNIPWPEWNAEQQAKCIEEYNTALHRLKTDSYPDDGSGARLRDIDTQSLAEPYLDLLRRKIGAPGSHPAPGTAGPHS